MGLYHLALPPGNLPSLHATSAGPGAVRSTTTLIHQMPDWMADLLTVVVPCPGAAVEKRDTIWLHPISFPLVPQAMLKALDEDFT